MAGKDDFNVVVSIEIHQLRKCGLRGATDERQVPFLAQLAALVIDDDVGPSEIDQVEGLLLMAIERFQSPRRQRAASAFLGLDDSHGTQTSRRDAAAKELGLKSGESFRQGVQESRLVDELAEELTDIALNSGIDPPSPRKSSEVRHPDARQVDNNALGVLSARLGRDAEWRELIATKKLLRAIDLSMPLVGTTSYLDALEALIIGGGSVQLLILNPVSPVLVTRRRAEAYNAFDELETTLAYVIRILRGFGQRLARHGEEVVLHRFDVRLFNTFPGVSAFLTDDLVHCGFYLEHLTGSRGPYLVGGKDGSLYECVNRTFESIWRHGDTISLYDPQLKEKTLQLQTHTKHEVNSFELPEYLT